MLFYQGRTVIIEMATDNRSREDILAEIEVLRFRLKEGEKVIQAIQDGRADAIVKSMPERGQVFTAVSDLSTIKEAERQFAIAAEHEQAIQSIRESEERHRLLANTMLQGVVHQDSSGTIIAMNPAAEHILGKKHDQFIGSNSVHEEHHCIREDGSLFPGMEHPSMLAMRTGQHVRDVVMGVFNPQRNQYRWIKIDAVPVFRPGEDHPAEVYTVFEDITERKEDQERLALATLYNGVGIWDWNLVTLEMVWDDSMYALYHIRAEDFSGAVDAWEKSLPPDDRERCEREVQAALAGEQPFDTEFRVCWPNGEVRYIKAKAKVFRRNGKPVRMLGTNIDITDRKRDELSLREKDRMLSESQRISHIGSWSIDLSSLAIVWSDETYRLYGLSPDTFTPTVKSIIELVHPDDRLSFQQQIATLAKGGEPGELVFRRTLPDGTLRYLCGRGAVIHDAEYKAVRIAGTVQDITESKQAEIRLQLAASVFTHSYEGILISDAEGTIIEVNDSFTHITGYPREDALGRKPSILKSGRHDRAFYTAMWNDLVTKGHWYGEIWNRRKDGEVYAEMITISAVLDSAGQTKHYVALFSDITPMKVHQQQLEHIAHYDALTGLPNRLLLSDRLEQAMAQAQRHGCSMAVAYLDLDGFKAINDEYGHGVGDALLVAIAGRMKLTSVGF